MATIDAADAGHTLARRHEAHDLGTLIALASPDDGPEPLTPAQFRQVASLAVRLLGLRPGLRVLDVGCGAGASSLALAARVGAGAKCWAWTYPNR